MVQVNLPLAISSDAQLYNTSNPSYGGAVVAFTDPEGIRSDLNLSCSELLVMSRLERPSASNSLEIN